MFLNSNGTNLHNPQGIPGYLEMQLVETFVEKDREKSDRLTE